MEYPLFELIEHTHRSVFLTGKAGTGKTTFLNELVKKTRKKYVVVAPTGIAAINASGVTIHSLFGLPLRPFLPTTDRLDSHLGNNISDLLQHFKYRRDKLKLFRELELLIIDEVSMLRADVLDMMDYSLRFTRRSTLPFGGVQILFIGDLYQLPPVVRDQEILGRFYPTPFFFSSKALEQMSVVTVELNKVYRQRDPEFIELLNAIRDGDIHSIDFEKLNSRYNADFDPGEESYVYLTSHNRMAEEINRGKLDSLSTPKHLYKANTYGDFKENQYPCEEELELKVGAQIMFIRNDSSPEKRYFNGKIAQITDLNAEEITVLIEGSSDPYTLKKETWEQKAYSLDAEKNIKEEVLGSFEQYPIRLAWAVTIHKSQGLTFDKVIIDAGKSFTSGQVYVALSRCRTLEGIVLKSEITPQVIFSDQRILKFQDDTQMEAPMEEILQKEKYDFFLYKLLQKLDTRWMNSELSTWIKKGNETKKIAGEELNAFHLRSKKEVEHLSEIYVKFTKVLPKMKREFSEGILSWEVIEQKSKGAATFFFKRVREELFEPLKDLYAKTKGTVGLKAFNDQTRDFLDELQSYLEDLRDLQLLEKPLLEEAMETDLSLKIKKVPSHLLSWRLFQEGKTLLEIEKERGVLRATLYGHFDRFAQEGSLEPEDLERIVAKEKITLFHEKWKEEKHRSLTEWKKELPEEFEFGEIRLLSSYFLSKEP